MSVFRNLLMSGGVPDVPLTYLRGTGTQYIDTGIKLNYNTNFDLKFELMSKTDTTRVMGYLDSYTTASTRPCHACFYNSTYGLYFLYNSSDWSRWSNAKSQVFPLKIYLEGRANIFYYKNFAKNTTYWNKTYATRTGQGEKNCLLFAHWTRNGGESDYHVDLGGDIKIYEFIIYGSSLNDIAHHFKPVLHNNIPCMVDEITGEYYYNQGTGNFIYG